MSEWNDAIEAAAKVCDEIQYNSVGRRIRSLKRPADQDGWMPIESAPKDGGYIATNRKRQVAFCDSRNGNRTIHNVTGFVEWD